MNSDDIGEEIAHIHLLIKERRRRLRPLEVQEAKYGKDCPPHVINEIQDIYNEIRTLEQRLSRLQVSTQTNREQGITIINPYSATPAPSKPTVQLQDSQTDTSSSLKLQYYYKLLKHKGWVAVFTVSSYVLYLSSNSGSGNIGFRYYVLTPFLQAMSFIGISLLCVLYGKHIWLFRILRFILALYFGVFGLIILLGSLQRLITYIIGG